MQHAEKFSMKKSGQPPDYDMIDTGEDLSKYRPLSNALRKCGETMVPSYNLADKSALRHQKSHRWLTNLAVGFGALAVLIAVVQLTGFVSAALPMWVEVLAAIIALAAVILGVVQSRQTMWLLQRHKAERCRLLKFSSLIRPDLWAEDPEQTRSWEDRLAREVKEVNELTPRTFREWAERRDKTDSPHETSRCVIKKDALRALIRYFRDKRLDVQMAFFESRANRYEGIDRYLRNVPPILFFLSVLVVFGHFVIDVFFESGHDMHNVSVLLIALAVSLPVTGAAIRSVRSANEFARSASLYRAKYEALKRIANGLSEEADCEEILLALRQGEQFLEAEHREWLGLMLEAEWFG